jgi:hypothetical protein
MMCLQCDEVEDVSKVSLHRFASYIKSQLSNRWPLPSSGVTSVIKNYFRQKHWAFNDYTSFIPKEFLSATVLIISITGFQNSIPIVGTCRSLELEEDKSQLRCELHIQIRSIKQSHSNDPVHKHIGLQGLASTHCLKELLTHGDRIARRNH